MQKGVFFCHFLGFGGFVFLFSVFLCFCFVQNSPKMVIFLQFLEVFCLFCSHKRPVLNCFFSSYFVFFCFCLPFQKSIFSLLFVHQPLFTTDSLWGFFFFFCLPFPFLMFACLFETNFPNIPFLKPKLLSFLAVYFSSVVLVFVFMVYVSAFLFLCWFCFWCFLFLFCVFVFVLFLVLLSVYEKKCFPCNSGVFFELCWLKG